MYTRGYWQPTLPVTGLKVTCFDNPLRQWLVPLLQVLSLAAAMPSNQPSKHHSAVQVVHQTDTGQGHLMALVLQYNYSTLACHHAVEASNLPWCQVLSAGLVA